MAAFYTVDQVWGAWSTGTTSFTPTYTGATSASMTNIVWQTWAATSTQQTLMTDTIAAWNSWNTYGQYVPPVLTEEQVEAQRVAAEARAAANAERAAQVAAAKERARTLLLDALAEDQQQELIANGHFHVETRDGTRRYRLSPTGQPRRVRGEDGLAWAYCIHPDHGYPQDDVVLAQKLLLEADEEAFLRIANARQVAA